VVLDQRHVTLELALQVGTDRKVTSGFQYEAGRAT
jgi:hypothetical protein